MKIGDKVKLVNHPFYEGRYARVIDTDEPRRYYKVKVDIDGKEIWTALETLELAKEEPAPVISPYFDGHYLSMKVQPIELAQDLLTPEEMIGAMKFSIIKYSLRAGAKEGEPAEKDETKKERYREWLKTLLDGKRIEV